MDELLNIAVRISLSEFDPQIIIVMMINHENYGERGKEELVTRCFEMLYTTKTTVVKELV